MRMKILAGREMAESHIASAVELQKNLTPLALAVLNDDPFECCAKGIDPCVSAIDERGNAIGFLCMLPIRSKAYEELETNEIPAGIISLKDISPLNMEAAGPRWGYLQPAALLPVKNKKDVLELMLKRWDDLIREIASDMDTYFIKIASRPFSKEEEELMKRIGLSPKRGCPFPFYEANLMDIDFKDTEFLHGYAGIGLEHAE